MQLQHVPCLLLRVSGFHVEGMKICDFWYQIHFRHEVKVCSPDNLVVMEDT